MMYLRYEHIRRTEDMLQTYLRAVSDESKLVVLIIFGQALHHTDDILDHEVEVCFTET